MASVHIMLACLMVFITALNLVFYARSLDFFPLVMAAMASIIAGLQIHLYVGAL